MRPSMRTTSTVDDGDWTIAWAIRCRNIVRNARTVAAFSVGSKCGTSMDTHIKEDIRMRFQIVFMAVLGLAAALLVPAQAEASQPQQSSLSRPDNKPSLFAQPARAGAPTFADLDKKGEGALHRSDIPKGVEALKQLRAHFDQYDTDHGGSLSPHEYEIYVHGR